MPNASRLVARMRKLGQARSRASASALLPSIRCSQLSSTKSISLEPRYSESVWVIERSCTSRTLINLRHSLRYEIGVRERSQLHQPHAVLEVLHHLEGHGERKARLAAPSRACKRKQAVIGKQPLLGLCDLPLAAYKACKL